MNNDKKNIQCSFITKRMEECTQEEWIFVVVFKPVKLQTIGLFFL